jgi:hypothetical protein
VTQVLGLRSPGLRRVAALTAGMTALAATVVLTTLLHTPDETSALASDGEGAAPRTVAAGPPPIAHAALPHSAPIRVQLPTLGVDTAVVALGRTPSGGADVPGHASTVGWLVDGPTPGEAGTAVLTGHIELAFERGSFFSLHSLRPRDTVRVVRADGRIGVFTVYRVEEVAQQHALAHATGPTDEPELRLLTAVNPVDARDPALVVSARLTAVTEGA